MFRRLINIENAICSVSGAQLYDELSVGSSLCLLAPDRSRMLVVISVVERLHFRQYVTLF